MSFLKWCSLASLLAFAVGCVGPGYGSGSSSSDARITIQGSFEKKQLTASGFAGTATLPARYCYAEVRQSNPDLLLASGYLGSDGTGFADIPRGTTFYVRVFAAVEVPPASGSTFFLRGSVMNGPAPASGATDAAKAATFQNTGDWVAETGNLTADGSRTVAVQARSGSSDLSGGAFAIADQMAAFALKVRDLEPTLRLPNLHVYWTTSNNPSLQTRAYPSLLRTSAGAPYRTSSNRAVFTATVFGQQGGAPDAETDEFDDAVLQETFHHLLFADYSAKEDGSSALSLLRRDNDNVYVSRYRQSESTVAFVGGACDFLAGATLGRSTLLDSYNDASGVLRVDLFDLSSHTQIPANQRGEFTRGSVAISLWGIYRNALGGGASALQTLWNALRSTAALSDGTGEYNGATLGCYPSYLVGVKSRVTGSQWSQVLGELAAENVPEPTASYFNSTALYVPISFGAPVTGSVQAYAPSEGRYYDRNQSQAHRFTQGFTTTRTVTLVPTGGQDLYLEVFGPGGWVNGSYANPGATRTLPLASLPPGVYAIRVRAGATTATTQAGYTLTIQ